MTKHKVTKKKSTALTHIKSVLHPLDDVEGIVHVAFQNVKLDIITA